jgi:hypothetical protein
MWLSIARRVLSVTPAITASKMSSLVIGAAWVSGVGKGTSTARAPHRSAIRCALNRHAGYSCVVIRISSPGPRGRPSTAPDAKFSSTVVTAVVALGRKT